MRGHGSHDSSKSSIPINMCKYIISTNAINPVNKLNLQYNAFQLKSCSNIHVSKEQAKALVLRTSTSILQLRNNNSRIEYSGTLAINSLP
jgi:hypothetical protein